jgi:hypothetical protein
MHLEEAVVAAVVRSLCMMFFKNICFAVDSCFCSFCSLFVYSYLLGSLFIILCVFFLFSIGLKQGASVQTPYGEGKVEEVYADEGVVSVSLPSGRAFVSISNVYPNSSGKKSGSATKYYTVNTGDAKAADTATADTAVLLLTNNKLYMFVRLYVMLYNRLRRAKELCRRASSQKKTIVRHWKDRVAATPRSPDHRTGQPHKDVNDNGTTMSSASSSSAANANVSDSFEGNNATPGSSAAETSSSSSSSAASSASTTTGEEGLKSQLCSHKTYGDFLGHVYELVCGEKDNATYEDICRALMGASTASYMMFTLDKLLNALMKCANAICEEGPSAPTSKLQLLFTQERSNAVNNKKNSRKEYAQRTLKVPFNYSSSYDMIKKGATGSSLASSSSSSSSASSSSSGGGSSNALGYGGMPEHLFRIHFVPGVAATTVPIAGSHGPGVWDETMAWSVQPQICVELVNEASKLRLEATLDPSVVDAATYKQRYLEESGSAGFGGHTIAKEPPSVSSLAGKAAAAASQVISSPKPSLFLPRNRRSVEKFTLKQGSLGYEDRDTGRDRRAREQLNLLRHGLQWGVGTIRTNEGLTEVVSLETDKLRYVSGTEDFMCRVYTPLSKGNGDSSSGGGSSDGSDGDGEGSGVEDADGDAAMGADGSTSSSSSTGASGKAGGKGENVAENVVKKSSKDFDAWLANAAPVEKSGRKKK